MAEQKWDTFGSAVADTLAKLEALGLPKEAHRETHNLLWTLGAWQGTRELKQGRLDLAERAYKLALSVNAEMD